MRFGEPVNKDAPSMKTVARRAPSSYTGAFTNQVDSSSLLPLVSPFGLN